MATTPALMSIEQYLRTSFSPDADFVEGEIQERNLGEFEHARLQWLLAAFFAANEKAMGFVGVVEQRIRVANDRVRICDVALLRANAPREKITATPPLVCIEVLSPEDRISRAKLVLSDYVAMGVENVWLIDPIRHAVFTFDGSGLHDMGEEVLTVPGTEISIHMQEIFEQVE